MPFRYSSEQLRALKPPAQHLDAALKHRLVNLGIFYQWVYAEHKQEQKRVRYRRRRKTNPPTHRDNH